MIKQPATVIAESEYYYLLETLPKSACPRCAEGKGCGGGILAQAFANKTYQLKIDKNSPLKVNELVQIGIQSAAIVRASLLLYIVPLILMVALALAFGSLSNNQDIYTVTGAMVGMILGIFIAKKLSVYYIKDSMASPILILDEEENCWYKAE